MTDKTEGVSAMSAELGGPHCASEWGGRKTGPFLYTSDEVGALLISERDARTAEIERLRAALLVMRGRLLLENLHAVTTEADELPTPQKEQG